MRSLLERLQRVPSSYRLAMLVFLLGSAVVAVVAQQTYRAGTDRLLDRTAQSQEADLRLMNELARPALLTGDYAALQQLLIDLPSEDAVIADIDVRDLDGIIVASTTVSDIGRVGEDAHAGEEREIVADRDVLGSSGLLGSIHVHFDQGTTLDAVAAGRRQGLLIGLLGIGSLALVTLAVAWGFSRRVSHITRELDHIGPDGVPTPVSVTGNDEIGAMARALNERTDEIASTMRSLREANAALRLSEAQAQLALETSADLMTRLDLGTGRITVITAQPDSELIEPQDGERGEQYLEDVHPDDLDGLVEAMADHLTDRGTPLQRDVRLRGRSGDWRQVRMRGRATIDEAAGTDVFLLTLVDTTDQRLLEHRSLHADKMRTIGRMTSGLAHDFNNALAVAGLNLAMLQEPTRDRSRDPEIIERLADAHQLAASLVDRLMRGVAPQAPDQPAPVDVHQLLDDLHPIFGQLLAPDIELVIDRGAENPVVSIEPGRANQVLLNLVANAGDAMGTAGTVTIRTASTRDEAGRPSLIITVDDDGPGIDPAVAETLFEPFVTTKELGVGTGLGLATTFESVTLAGGTISARTRVGGGARFTIVLPNAAMPTGEAGPDQDGDAGSAEPQMQGVDRLKRVADDRRTSLLGVEQRG